MVISQSFFYAVLSSFRYEFTPSFSAQLLPSPSCGWIAVRADLTCSSSHSSAISDSEEDYVDEKDNSEEGVDEAVDENGTIGDNQNDIVYIYSCF